MSFSDMAAGPIKSGESRATVFLNFSKEFEFFFFLMISIYTEYKQVENPPHQIMNLLKLERDF